MNEVYISFLAVGHVNQTVRLREDITPEQLVAGLGNGTYLTTMQEDGEIIAANGEVVGVVLDVENKLTYKEFQMIRDLREFDVGGEG